MNDLSEVVQLSKDTARTTAESLRKGATRLPVESALRRDSIALAARYEQIERELSVDNLLIHEREQVMLDSDNLLFRIELYADLMDGNPLP